MKVMVVGSGGREHAMAWRLARSPRVSKVFVAPGNAGTAQEDGVANVPMNAIPDLVDFARRERLGFTVVGPEAPLAAGIVDAFRSAALPIFGPTAAAAQLESSKDFAKRFMQRHGIPTAEFATFEDAAAAHAYIDARGAPIVVKADGLAAGKGVVVATTLEEAHAAIDAMLGGGAPGGSRVVVEEFLEGEEASFIVVAHGLDAVALASSQDHKRLLDGDEGPNTGGMGAYSPAPVVTPELHARVMREIIQPTLAAMAAEGLPYTGFLYAGLMIDRDGNPRTLEFNCRLGDPETQPIMMRMKSDLADLLEFAIDGRLQEAEMVWDRRVAVGVVIAAAGYPGEPRKGDAIIGLPQAEEDLHVFHAATARNADRIVTNGGRVLCVTALGDNVRSARQRAYEGVQSIRFDGMQVRTDIGWRALQPRR